ncbi:uncharacterized protein LOC109005010 isoform X1 [Juglans regia]|uniref:Uncharacterized protein LOC109005010 isoform X1 n=2 Tax=Juglans regia TaxID=51240 RepID=A0A2I4G5Y0_JUGRE|nr:uncharacterized protein LOC109005010 isoform X1 [Juglans regia]
MAQTELREKQRNAPESPQNYDIVWEEMESHRKKRKRRKRKRVIVKDVEEKMREEEGVLRSDPLEVFGTDMMSMILSNLDARSVALSLLVSRGWHGVASSDRIWGPKLEELWVGKAHIPRLSQIRGLSKLTAYSLAVRDGKRNRIRKDDLCDHVWEFHFNKGAPEYWRNLDPYWKGTGLPMRRYFHPDGSQSADPDDKVWGGHECCYSTVTSIVGEDKIREHYVRINRWPRMSVSRKQDWSWELSNCLYSYSSIPNADREGGTGPLYGLV